jgi:hypothetical protein
MDDSENMDVPQMTKEVFGTWNKDDSKNMDVPQMTKGKTQNIQNLEHG